MFFHNFKYSLKTLIRVKPLVFWTFAFPLILGTFFNLAFSGLDDVEDLEIINVAVVENENLEESLFYKEAFDEINKVSDEKIFNITYEPDEASAKKLLIDEEITGYVIIEDVPNLIINKNGIEETAIRQMLDEIAQTGFTFENIIKKEIMKDPENISEEKIEGMVTAISEEIMDSSEENSLTRDTSPKRLSSSMVYFYTLIAMTAMYGGMLAMESTSRTLANMTDEGKRVAVSPTPRWNLILSSLLASFVLQLLSITVLFIYTRFVLNIDYGDNVALIVLLTLLGCIAGLSFGIFIETVLNANEKVKTGVLIGVTMFGSFLTGMMGVEIKYYVDTHFPIVNMVNPARMITDGFYSLYYYDTLDRYKMNIISILIFIAVVIGISMFKLRRQKYDNI